MNNNPKGNPATLKSFPSKWSTSDTKVVRVPTYLAERVVRYARDLDSRKDKSDRHVMTSDDVRNMLAVVDVLRAKIADPKARISKFRQSEMNEQLRIMQSLVPAGPADLSANRQEQ